MIRFEQLKNKPQRLRCLTGLSLAAFGELRPAFGGADETDRAQRDEQRATPRPRSHGAGPKGVLPRGEDKRGFLLCYFRRYPVPMAQGSFFGRGQPPANDGLQRWRPILKPALGYQMPLPAGAPKAIQPVLAPVQDGRSFATGANATVGVPKTSSARGRSRAASKRVIPVNPLA
jgi:hypothetical protein